MPAHGNSTGEVAIVIILALTMILGGPALLRATGPSQGTIPAGIPSMTPGMSWSGGEDSRIIPQCSNCMAGNISVGNFPQQAGYDSGRGYVYVPNAKGSSVSVIADNNNTVIATIPVEKSPFDSAYDSNNGYDYVTNLGSNTLSVISGTRVLTTISVGIAGWNDLYDPGNGYIYVCGSNATMTGAVVVVDPTLGQAIKTIPVGVGPWALAYDSANGDIYTANHGAGSGTGADNSTVISGATDTVIAEIPFGVSPWGGPSGAAYDSGNGDIYIVNEHTDNVSVIDGSSNTVLKYIPVGLEPYQIAYDSSNGDLYVVNNMSASVSVISGVSNSVIATIPLTLNQGSFGITYDSRNGFLYVEDEYINAVTLVAPYPSTPYPSSVTVTPSPTSVNVGRSVVFTATPSCTGGPCPAGITYTWSLTNGLGTLNSSASPVVNFTAGSLGGTETLFVNASLNTMRVQSVPVLITILPALFSVSMSPQTDTLNPFNTATFTASTSCSGGPCPSGITYAWSLNNSLGTLSPSSAPSVTFTAGNAVGQLALFVNGTLNGVRMPGGPALITIAASVPSLLGVNVTPPADTVGVGGSVGFIASPVCAGGPCPAGLTYQWTLSAPLGILNQGSGSNVVFTAGSSPGTLTLYLNATLNGAIQPASPVTINVTSPSPPPLASIGVTAASNSMQVGGTVALTATPSCTGGPCQAGVVVVWTLTGSGLGTLSSTQGTSVTFTAGSNTGNVTVAAAATLNQRSVSSAPVTLAIIPALTSVVVTPGSLTILQGASATFGATPVCSGGWCPTGATYVWSLPGALGTLNPTTTPTTTFTAGPAAGTGTLNVNVSLNGVVRSAAVSIQVFVPALAGVTVSPASADVTTGATQAFSSSISCTGGPCPSGATYAWTLSRPVGILDTSLGAWATFTAGNTPGTATIFLNVSLGTVVKPATMAINVTYPSLTNVSVTPTAANLSTGGVQLFLGSTACGGSPCPPGVVYAWKLSSPGGTLSAATGSAVVFTAGPAPGTVTLLVNATLGGKTLSSPTVKIQIAYPSPVLSSVSLSPATQNMLTGHTAVLNATVQCGSGPCPLNATVLVWSLNNTLGGVSSTSGISTTFVAGDRAGTTQVTVTASLHGVTKSASEVITVSPPMGTVGSTTPDLLVYALATLSLILLVALLAALLFRRRGREDEPGLSDGAETGTTRTPEAGSPQDVQYPAAGAPSDFGYEPQPEAPVPPRELSPSTLDSIFASRSTPPQEGDTEGTVPGQGRASGTSSFTVKQYKLVMDVMNSKGPLSLEALEQELDIFTPDQVSGILGYLQKQGFVEKRTSGTSVTYALAALGLKLLKAPAEDSPSGKS